MEMSSPSNAPTVFNLQGAALDEVYCPLLWLYVGFLATWFFSTFYWAINTWRNRHLQINSLLCFMAVVPLIKAVQLGLSFSFCLYNWNTLSNCIFYDLHAYISLPERRMTASLSCGLYLTLVGYKASIPYFAVFALLNYSISFYLIFRKLSENLLALREQLCLIEDEGAQSMHNILSLKYTMVKYVI